MINYDAVVSNILLSEFPQTGETKIYHDRAPETGDVAYPFIVYKTLSLSPVFHADNRNWSYQHTVRITVVGKNGSTKSVNDRILESMETAGYIWQNTYPTVEDREYGETYTAMDFVSVYWR